MNAELEKNGYIVIKNFLPKELCKFIQVYFKIRQDTLEYTIDDQCPKSKSFYADPLIETLLITSCKKLSEITEIDLVPQYSYARVYGKGDELKIHRDRPECEFSATICLGRPSQETNSAIYMSKQDNINTGTELFLEEGDLCFYRGTEIYHWRKPFDQSWFLQAFIHYTDKNSPYGDRIFDGRRTLGIKK
jgi:hypothetical protein